MKLWRMRRGNNQKGSFVITIPKDKVLALGWDEGDQLVLDRLGGKLVIENLTKRNRNDKH